MVPKWSQNGPRTAPSRVQTAFGFEFEGGNASKTECYSETPALLDPKLIQNWSKIDEKSKNIDSKINFEFDVVFLSILDAFWKDFDAKMEPSWDENLT